MNKDFLFEMLTTPSVSGNEIALERKLYDYVKTYADEVRTDEIGDVIAVLNRESSCRVLLCGHADEIGLMVTAVTEKGMLKVTKIGGIYPSTYLGHKVRIMTEQGIIYGSVAVTRDLSKKADLRLEDLTIDIGAKDKEDALKYISLGDTVIFDTDYRELLNECINGRALDDRAGAFIVMEAARRAKEKGCKVGVYAAATVGEETTRNGAFFVAERVRPTMAIAVDVTYASDYPGTEEATTGDIRVGGGPVLVNNPSCHKKMQKLLREAAKKCNVAVQTEAANGKTYTDADTIHTSGQGVPITLVSIPLRYMHTPAELGSLKDIENCIELLAEFLCGLEEDVNLKWF